MTSITPLDRYTAPDENFGLVVPHRPRRIAVLGARSAPKETGNQPRALSGYQGQSPWLVLLLVYLAIFVAAPIRPRAQAFPDRPGDTQPVTLMKPRVQPLPEAQWTNVHRELVAKFARYGRVDNGFKTLLNVPGIVEGVMPFTIYLSEESTLSPRHRELLILRTAWLCGNQSLWSRHAARARTAAITTEEIRRVAQGPDASGWDVFERTLLQMADQLYRNSAVTDGTWKALAAKYDVLRLMDAVETVNHFTFLSSLYNSFGVQPDEGITDRLPSDVRYKVVVPDREPAPTVARIDPVAGERLAVFRTFARHPKLTEPRMLRTNYIGRGSPLSPRHRELLILRMGWNCQSEYVWAHHVGAEGRAREHGLDPVRIAQGPDAHGWDPFEADLLRAVDELYRGTLVSDRTWNALAARVNTVALMSVVYTAGGYRTTSMVINTYGVQLEPGNERFPQIPPA